MLPGPTSQVNTLSASLKKSKTPKPQCSDRGLSLRSRFQRKALLLRRLLVLPAIALHASGGVHQFLLAGKERVAVGADFQADVAFVSGTGHKHVAASAMYAHFMVCGMDRCLHGPLNLSW